MWEGYGEGCGRGRERGCGRVGRGDVGGVGRGMWESRERDVGE